MDRLRSLQYFLAAAEAGSFSAAARQLDVSVPAVAKLIGTLERELGLKLFERRSSGLVLSAGGSGYLEACRPALALLASAEEQARGLASARPRGTVVVATQPLILQECLTTALPRFNELFPEIQIDLRFALQPTDPQAHGADVLLLLGWPRGIGDLVQRHIGSARFVICAAPSYWAAHGMPRHPEELERHNCICTRGNVGTVLDVWRFERGTERAVVTVRGWLVSDNAHRDAMRSVAIEGGGVMRLIDWYTRRGDALAGGALVPALTDWEVAQVPPMNLLYPASARRVPRVRVFIDFVSQLLVDIERRREAPTPVSAPPRWLHGHYARASSVRSRAAG